MNFWPENRSGAVSLTFDDGMESHLQIVIPEMNQRNLRGTFYINPKGDDDETSPKSWKKLLERWIEPSKTGHEIGNHSINHPCSLNINATFTQKNLLRMTLKDIEEDLTEAQARLRQVFPFQTNTSFAYPCYETSVGRGVNRVSYIPIVAKIFIAARARGEMANDPFYCDLHHLSSFPVERMPAPYLIGLVEQAIAAHRWAIFTFHGINEGHLPVSQVDFIELLDHLVRRNSEVWTAPVAEIASYIQSMTHSGA